MHLIKSEHYFWAFNKPEAIKQFEILKNKNLAILDFEAFQFWPNNKARFSSLDMNDIPFTVGISYVNFDIQHNQFVVKDEKVYQFKDAWTNEKELLNQLYEMSIFIGNFIKENNIEKFIFLSDYLEKTALHFFDQAFKNLPCKLSIDYYDLYKYFMNKRNFTILSYEYTEGKFLKSIMNVYHDEYDNKNIGRDASLFFNKHIRNQSCEDLDFEKIKQHNVNDLKKGLYLLNELVKFSEWPDQNTINKEFISIKESSDQ